MRKNPAKRGRGTAWPQEPEDMYPPPGGLVSHCPTNSPHLSSAISLCTQVKCITAPLRIFCISPPGSTASDQPFPGSTDLARTQSTWCARVARVSKEEYRTPSRLWVSDKHFFLFLVYDPYNMCDVFILKMYLFIWNPCVTGCLLTIWQA